MISVCMTTFNGEKFISNQIESILMQLSDTDELIISDDGSTDDTLNIIKSYMDADDRITLFFGPKLGLISNFEYALKQASGEYIFLSDQDDVWMPNKVELMLEKLDDNLLVISDCQVVDKNLDLMYPSFFQLNGLRRTLFSNLIKNSYLGCCMAFRREVLLKSLPFPKSLPMHDWWIGLCAACSGSVYFCTDKLVMYRRHGSNSSPTSEKSHYSIIKKIQFRSILILNLFKRYLYA